MLNYFGKMIRVPKYLFFLFEFDFQISRYIHKRCNKSGYTNNDCAYTFWLYDHLSS